MSVDIPELFPCEHCGHFKEDHDAYELKCLFGPGVWTPRVIPEHLPGADIEAAYQRVHQTALVASSAAGRDIWAYTREAYKQLSDRCAHNSMPGYHCRVCDVAEVRRGRV